MTQFQLTDLIVVLFLSLVVGYLVVSFLIPERVWKHLSRRSRFPRFNRHRPGRGEAPPRVRPSHSRSQATESPAAESATGTVPTEREHAEILGLSGRVTLGEIKAAYRSEIVRYHPDKVAHLAVEFREMAQTRTRRIREAYEYFRGKYGLR